MVPQDRVYSQPPRPGRIAAAALAGALLLAGCGGGAKPAQVQAVRGPGFSFSAPPDWQVTVTRRQAAVRQGPDGLVSVTVFPLLRPYRPALWRRVRDELDGVAEKLAASLRGRLQNAATVKIAGLPGRRYEISYAREGTRLRQRITFLLRGRTEYQLLCRFREAAGEPQACRLLAESFKPR